MSKKVKKRTEWTTEMWTNAVDLFKDGYSQLQAAVLSGIPRENVEKSH